jgi:predicted ATPase/DNA-binding CsgD family transcriptional regulator
VDAGPSQRLHLPSGTVTFLLADLDASARLQDVATRHGGICQIEPRGNALMGVFDRTSDAVAAALALQDGTEPSPRIALHAAEAGPSGEGRYFGRGVGQCARLWALAHPGQVLLSRAAHDLVVDALPADVTLVDLGMHELGDLGRLEQVFGLAHAGLPDPLSPLARDDAPPRNLPSQLTSFVGRERELAELGGVLADARLVTLTGAGGCGKTRLALQAAAEYLDRFPDGAWWIDLAPLAEPGLVGAAIAEPLGVRPLPGLTELQAVCGLLASRRALVLLDNCEHLLDACAEAAEALVQAGEGVTVLATSRAPLGPSGEVEWRVPSLSLPELRPTEPSERIRASDAVRLFIERAVSARRGFAVTGDNSAAVARICADVDGIPLAIELAAARVRMLSVEQVADGLSDRLRVLSGGTDTSPPRQQTLRASVDWSYELLGTGEQALLRRLSVFAGGCNLEAVEEVCAGHGIDPYDVLDLLGSLVDKSLVMAEERGPKMRYRLLETVRQYGLDRLGDAGEIDAVRDRHLDYFLGLAERAAPELERKGHSEWIATLDPEGANLLGAIDRAADTRPRLALRICAALFLWWRGARLWAEAETAIARSLAAAEDEPAGPRAAVLWTRGFFAVGAGRLETAREHGTEALALAREAGDASSEARALNLLGVGEMYAAPAAGRASVQRALDLARAENDDYVQIEASDFIALSYLFQDDHEQIDRVLDEAATAGVPRTGMGQAARHALIRASVALLDGRLPEAREMLAAALAAEDAGDEPVIEAWNDAQVALIDILEGHPEQALERLLARLDHVIETGAGLAIPALLTWASWAEISSGRLEEARQRLEVVIPIVDGRDCLLSLWANWHMAETLRLLADEGAEAAAARTREIGREVGNRFAGSRGDMTLARLAAARGDWSRAEQHLLAHLDAVVEGGHLTFVPYCFDALAEVAAGLHSHEEAVRLLAAGERARKDLGVGRWTPEAGHWASIERGLREVLGDAGFDAARAAGADLSIDEALGWARRARGSRKRPPSGWESLTPTEAQVVELAAQGLTNPQIGERMFISRATVKVHLAHIFRKLEVRNRADLAAKAARRDT